MASVLITGANRGIGLALCEHYLGEGWQVIATCRAPEAAADLQRLAEPHADRCSLMPLEVTDPGSISPVAARLAGKPLDLLINNAGVSGKHGGSFGRYNYRVWQETLAINTLGPLRVTEALHDSLRRGEGKTVVNVTSQLGSITNANGGFDAYAVSKAALNMALRNLAADLRSHGIRVLMLHPGWVRTDMGGPSAPVTPQQSAAGIARVAAQTTLQDSGRFLDYRGAELPW